MDPTLLKTVLESQQAAYKGATDILVSQFNSRIVTLEEKVLEVIKSLEFSQKEVDELKTEIKKLKKDKEEDNKRIAELVKCNEAVKEQMRDLEKLYNYQEDYNRRNNLRISGVKELDDGETWEQTAVIVKSLLESKLQLPDLTIERAHRIGQRLNNGQRTIIARFARYSDREAVMRNSRKLKGTRIFINEDLCPASQELVKNQLPQLKQARADGKIAFFKYTKLIIKDRTTLNSSSNRDEEEAAGKHISAGTSRPVSQTADNTDDNQGPGVGENKDAFPPLVQGRLTRGQATGGTGVQDATTGATTAKKLQHYRKTKK